MWAGFPTAPGPTDIDFAAVALKADKTYTIQVATVVPPNALPFEIPDLPSGTITITSKSLPPTPEPGPQHTTCQTAQALEEGTNLVSNTITGLPLDPAPAGLPPITSPNYYSFTPPSDGVYDISIQCPDAPKDGSATVSGQSD